MQALWKMIICNKEYIEIDFYLVFFISYKSILEVMFYYRTDLNTYKNGAAIDLKYHIMNSQVLVAYLLVKDRGLLFKRICM